MFDKRALVKSGVGEYGSVWAHVTTEYGVNNERCGRIREAMVALMNALDNDDDTRKCRLPILVCLVNQYTVPAGEALCVSPEGKLHIEILDGGYFNSLLRTLCE